MGTEVEDIKARLSVTEVVGGYVQLTKAGINSKGLCPFHREKSPSFVVSEERGSWHCFGCNKGGDIFTFIMEIESLSFPEALSILAERAGVEIRRRSREEFPSSLSNEFSSGEMHSDSGASKQRLFEVVDLAVRFFEKQLWDGLGRKTALPYLLDRGLSDASIRQFRLGFAPSGWRNLTDFLRSRGFSDREMEMAGLSISRNKEQGTGSKEQGAINKQPFNHSAIQPYSHSYDRFRERIMFPVMDALGRAIGFSARVLPGADESTAKYINTPETPLYHKSKALYGFSLAKQSIREAGEAIFVEGNMDVIAMHQAGFRNTVAVSGTALTEEQLRLIRRFSDRLSLFFDMDTAGQKAARKSVEAAFPFGFSVSLISLPAGKDAAEAARSDIDSLRLALAEKTSAPEYFLSAAIHDGDTRTPEGRRHIAENFLPLVALVSHEMDRTYWVSRLSSAIGVEDSALFSMLNSFAPRVLHDEMGSAPDQGNRNVHEPSFEKRSDLLGDNLLTILFAAPKVFSSKEVLFPKRVREFLNDHPFARCFSWDDMVFDPQMVPETLQTKASQLAFRGESLLEPMISNDADKTTAAIPLMQQAIHVLNEALRREAVQCIEHEMRLARERSDRVRERDFTVELVELSREKD